MRWGIATVVAFTLSGLLVALALVGPDDEKPHVHHVDMPEAITQCATDADCLLVDRIGCCACQSGGPRGAINATQQETLRRFIKKTCRQNAVCVRVDACQRDLAAVCAEGRCMARATHG